MVTIEERVSRLEGEYGHLATKADITELRGEIQGIKWTLGVAIGGVAVGLVALQVTLKYLA